MEHLEEKSTEPESDGVVVRVLGAVFSPLVVVWDGISRGLMAFFGAAEKLDPLALGRRLVAPFEPLAIRIGHVVANLFRPLLEGVRRLGQLLFGWMAPVVAAIGEYARRLGRWLSSVGQAALRATATLRTQAAAAFARIRAFARGVLEPVRRARTRAIEFVDRVKARLKSRGAAKSEVEAAKPVRAGEAVRQPQVGRGAAR